MTWLRRGTRCNQLQTVQLEPVLKNWSLQLISLFKSSRTNMTHLRRCRERTGPGNRAAQVSWLWSVPPGIASDLLSVALKLNFGDLQVVDLKLLQELWCLNLQIPKLRGFAPLETKLLEFLVMKVSEGGLMLLLGRRVLVRPGLLKLLLSQNLCSLGAKQR